ncbi:outer membrane protein assembly factor BamC [Planctobacterium marinum]|uniref:outer membrane protein assembly factor BamC n=1 Tax=Planctobacterium marinum TaxID=1631968 RepID=UPI001E2B213B|nr:outer membrane protein assembly factor BamC [Planctobacterium marinum]MCC2604155.1 outer membrane protein assembly factor BamC [Planctobacterium marinum]
MQKIRKSAPVVAMVLSVGLSGCALWQDEQKTDPSYPYLDSRQTEKVKVPQGKDTPQFGDEYDIPNVGANAESGELGAKLDISSPRLVLPVVTGSRILEGSREAIVQFDQVRDDVALDTAIWNSLISYLDERGIAVVDFDKSQQRLKTDWMIIEDDGDSPWYSWTKTDRKVGQRFEFTLDIKAHGRSATLYTKLVDYLETIDEKIVDEISEHQVRKNEVEVLNDVISHYEKQLTLADIRKARQVMTGLPMELGFDADGNAAYLVSASYDVTWPRLLLVLRKLGFNVKDLDQSTGLIFATYAGVDEGWWSSLFSSNNKLEIEQDDYRVVVKEQGEKTSLSLRDAEDNPLSASKISEMYPAFQQVMTTNDLDI